MQSPFSRPLTLNSIPLKKSYFGPFYPHCWPRKRGCLDDFRGFFSGILIRGLTLALPGDRRLILSPPLQRDYK